MTRFMPLVLGVVVVMLAGSAPARAAGSGKALGTVRHTNAAAVASQKKIDKLADKTRRMLHEYRNAVRKTQQLSVYNSQLSDVVDQQQQRKKKIEHQIQAVHKLHDQIQPLMLRMVDWLQQSVRAGLPFKQQQRQKKLATLHRVVADPTVDVGEKFQQLLDAYQRESQYSRSIATYRGKLTFSGTPRTVDFLRVGTTMLFYITADHADVGYYDRKTKSWQPLRASYLDSVRKAVRQAKGLAKPQLMPIGMPAPVPAQQQGLPDGSPPAQEAHK